MNIQEVQRAVLILEKGIKDLTKHLPTTVRHATREALNRQVAVLGQSINELKNQGESHGV